MRIISHKEIEGAMDLGSFFDIYLFADLCTVYGHASDFARVASALLDWVKSIQDQLDDYLLVLSRALSAIQVKIESKTKLSTKAVVEMYSLLSDTLFNIYTMLHSDSRIATRMMSRFTDDEGQEDNFLIIQIAEIYEHILLSNHTNGTEDVSIHVFLMSKYLSVQCGRVILKRSFTEQLKSIKGMFVCSLKKLVLILVLFRK